jgi:nucleoside transporter
MKVTTRIQLSAMMFLQFFIWSVWYVTMSPYLREVLKCSPQEVGIAYTATGWAAFVSPFFVGMVADRFFAAQRIMAVLHFLGGLCMLGVSQARSFGTFFPLLLGHTLCFMPTLALANTLAMKQMEDPGKQFSRVAVFGTIGWIAAGQLLGLFGGRQISTPISFQLACAVSWLMGLYALTLPHTPPKAAGQRVTARDILGLDALSLLKDPSFAVFVVTAFLFCIPLNLYFSFTPSFLEDFQITNVAGTMTLGQFSEILFMVVMPWFLARLGIKWVFVLGMLGWSVRYLLFFLGYRQDALWPLYAGVALHGICYVFFFVLAYIYVDKKAPETIRTKAQGFIALVTLGLGFLVGGVVSGRVVQQFSFPAVEPTKFKLVRDATRLAVNDYVRWEVNGVPAFGRITALNTNVTSPTPVTATVEVFDRKAGKYHPSGKTQSLPVSALTKPMTRWGRVWALAAGAGLVLMVLFALVFQHKEQPKPLAAQPGPA